MKLEKTFHDEIQQILKLGSAIKVIPWTAGESSRSKKIYNVCENVALNSYVFGNGESDKKLCFGRGVLYFVLTLRGVTFLTNEPEFDFVH